MANGKESKKTRLQRYARNKPSLTNLQVASGGTIGIEDPKNVKETSEDKPAESKDISKPIDQIDAVEGGNFKDLRKAINLSDNPAMQQRLQNRLNKLEIKKGFKAEELKAKGEKQIAKMKYGRKGWEEGLAKEKAETGEDLYYGIPTSTWKEHIAKEKKSKKTEGKVLPHSSGLQRETETDAYLKTQEDREKLKKLEYDPKSKGKNLITSNLNITGKTPVNQAERDLKFQSIAQDLQTAPPSHVDLGSKLFGRGSKKR